VNHSSFDTEISLRKSFGLPGRESAAIQPRVGETNTGPVASRGCGFAWLRGLLCPLVLLLAGGCQHGASHPFPIGIYSVPESDLALVRNAGFNIVTGPAYQNYLNEADRVGLKVLAAPGTSAGKSFNADAARRTVAKFDGHPALWSWYLVDEPDLNGVSPEEVRLSHRFLKNIGAKKPTALVLYQGGEALHFANIADITMVDRYPIPWLPLANFPQHVRLARLALGQRKRLLAVIQAFDWRYYPKMMPGEGPWRPPTSPELRCMTYSALARRANGIFYYCYNDQSWKMSEHPETWEALRSVVSEIKSRLPLFQAEHLWWPCIHEFPGATGFNAALESSIIPALLRVRSGNVNAPSGDYLLAVNVTDRPLRYRITLPEGNSGKLALIGESRTLTVSDDWLEDNFGPFDVHIYGPLPQPQRKRP
jgi:hypothetical protein